MWLSSSSSVAETLKWPNISTRTEISSGFNITSDITRKIGVIFRCFFFLLSVLDLILT